ncbi:hypothetical protein F4680DRAFT_423109, partial [Xylaria scruposa]
MQTTIHASEASHVSTQPTTEERDLESVIAQSAVDSWFILVDSTFISVEADKSRCGLERKVEFYRVPTDYMTYIQIRQGLTDIVVMDTPNTHRFWGLDLRFGHETVRDNINADILVLAAANEHCGPILMIYLLWQYGPLRDLIQSSPAIVTAAAGNTNHGLSILEMLYGRHVGVENRRHRLRIPKLAVMKAAIDEGQGLAKLKFFFRLRQRDFIGHMIAIFNEKCGPDEEEERELMPEAKRELE